MIQAAMAKQARTSSPQITTSYTRSLFEPISLGRRSSAHMIDDASQWEAVNHITRPANNPRLAPIKCSIETLKNCGMRIGEPAKRVVRIRDAQMCIELSVYNPKSAFRNRSCFGKHTKMLWRKQPHQAAANCRHSLGHLYAADAALLQFYRKAAVTLDDLRNNLTEVRLMTHERY
jgi:hypothetical protein